MRLDTPSSPRTVLPSLPIRRPPGRRGYRRLAGAGILIPLLLSAPPVLADSPLTVEPAGGTFAGQATDTVFPEQLVIAVGDRSYRLRALGSGTRRQLLFKVYECAPYAEVGAVLKPDATRAMIDGDFAWHIMLQFVRETTGEKVRDAYERGFAKVLEEVTPELAEDKARLLSYFTGGIAEGETIELTRVPGDALYVRIGGKDRPSIANDELASAIMAIWLGDEPVHPELKRNMLRFVEKP